MLRCTFMFIGQTLAWYQSSHLTLCSKGLSWFPEMSNYSFKRLLMSFKISDPHPEDRQVSFSEVNCPHSMSGNSAGSKQWHILNFTLKWTHTIIQMRDRWTLAVFQGKNVAFKVSWVDIWKGQMSRFSHDWIYDSLHFPLQISMPFSESQLD